jgi:hypothetical protein
MITVTTAQAFLPRYAILGITFLIAIDFSFQVDWAVSNSLA